MIGSTSPAVAQARGSSTAEDVIEDQIGGSRRDRPTHPYPPNNVTSGYGNEDGEGTARATGIPEVEPGSGSRQAPVEGP